METLDFKSFIRTLHPFDALDNVSLNRLLESVDILYFAKDETILKEGDGAAYYHIIAKGLVAEYQNDEIITRYFAKDSFDAPALINNVVKSTFKATEETIVFGITKAVFLELLKSNASFESYYLQDISQKIKSLVNKDSSKEMSSFLLRRVRESFLHEIVSVSHDTPIREAVQVMNERNLDALIINFPDGTGIVTDKDLRRKVLVTDKPLSDPIGDIATYHPIAIDHEDFLFNALLLMTERSIKRVVVTEGETMIGILEQMDIISLFSNRSTLITMRIEKAKTLEELGESSREMIYVIESLLDKGVKVRHITKLLNELNHKLFRKTFSLVAPAEIVENSCLIVLGSEGRKEQVLKTDQDNALIIKEGFSHPELEATCHAFSDALKAFGYPECPGKIMVSNPEWRKDVKAFKNTLFDWTHTYTEEGMMNLAIFFDAAFIHGDKSLLEDLKEHLSGLIKSDTVFFSNFAKPSLMFETPLSFLSNFVTEKSEHKGELDIKKGAIFSLVHGIRAVAMEKGIRETNTVDRIKAINNMGLINKEFASELIESFNFLLTLRVNAQLEKLKSGKAVDNYLNPNSLTKLDRDLLRDVFKVVNEFKKFLSHHFKLAHVV